MDDRPLHVVGPKWMSADLGGVHDYGFDVPDRPTDFWCSGAHYASLRASEFEISFSTPGGMIPLVDSPWRSEVSVLTLAEVLDDPPRTPVFSKLNDLKLTPFIACVRTPGKLVSDLEAIAESAMTTDPESMAISLTPPLDLSGAMEVRCFVLDGRAVSACPYSDGLGQMGNELDHLLDDRDRLELCRLVDRFAEQTPGLPRAFVIDFAYIEDEWVVLETNPASSSSWYCDQPPPGVAEAIRAGQHDDDAYEWTDPMRHLTTVPLLSHRLAEGG